MFLRDSQLVFKDMLAVPISHKASTWIFDKFHNLASPITNFLKAYRFNMAPLLHILQA